MDVESTALDPSALLAILLSGHITVYDSLDYEGFSSHDSTEQRVDYGFGLLSLSLLVTKLHTSDLFHRL